MKTNKKFEIDITNVRREHKKLKSKVPLNDGFYRKV
jgi:hypothetical protein